MKRRRQETFREKISITQQYLAEYLGISQTLLSLYEKGLRNLPSAAALKLAKLELAYYQLQQAKSKKTIAPLHPHLQKHSDKTKKAMEYHAETCNYKKLLAQRQLDTMNKEYAKATVLLDLLDRLSAETADAVGRRPGGGGKTLKNKETGIDHLWIGVQKNEALKKMIRHGDASQAKLQARILSLQAEADVYERLHTKMQ